MWEYLQVADFLLALALLAFTLSILLMLRKADPELLRAKLFLERRFLQNTWMYILVAILCVAAHELSWLFHYTPLEELGKLLFLLFLGVLIAQWFALSKECMR